MTTVAELIEETRGHLRSGAAEHLNTIAACDAATTTVTLQRTPLTQVGPGTLLSVGLETMRAWAVLNATAGTVEVRRGHDLSTAVIHSGGELVRIAPVYTDHVIWRALNNEIRALSGAGLFQMKVATLTSSSTGVRTYSLPADVLDVYDVRYDSDAVANQWPRVRSWTWLPDMPVGEFAGGNALRFDAGVQTGRPVRVFYRAKLGLLSSSLSADVETLTGLKASALDLPPIGAAWRLVMPEEVERNQTQRQGDTRRAEEVPPGAKLRSASGLALMRRDRIREEKDHLHRIWPGLTR